ncbi:MAG: hypothetical protein M1834_002175 [Cirrosporium novae-zelandiae]|nr:MAG: hypothetical protein M1834_002175 [Cirrosporium novae-zelandiae]
MITTTVSFVSATSTTIPTSTSILSSSRNSSTHSETGLLTASGTPTIPSKTTSFSASTSTATASATIQPTGSKSKGLSTGQIVGISVAAVASAIVVLGLLIFVCCLRKRRKLEDRSPELPFDFPKSQFDPLPSPEIPMEIGPRDIDVRSGNGGEGSSQDRPPVGERRYSFWRKSAKPEEIGIAISPESPRIKSTGSFESYRTTSQLLPEKPSYTLFPPPSRPYRPNRPESVATDFEEDVDGDRKSMKLATLQDPSARNRAFENSRWPAQPVRPLVRPQNTYTTPRAQGPSRERGSRSLLPRLVTPDASPESIGPPAAPSQAQRPRTPTPPVPTNKKLMPPERSQQNLTVPGTATSSIYSSSGSLPPSEPRESVDGKGLREQGNEASSNSTRLSRKSLGKRSSTRYSTASSETSFESADDEETPPEQDMRLSPVVESPDKSPISGLRYPKLPRPSSWIKGADRKAVPTARFWPERGSPDASRIQSEEQIDKRREGALSRDQSPSSLLAKRKGERAAQLEQSMKLKQGENGIGKRWKVQQPNEKNEKEAQMRSEASNPKSPVWNPKLTPTRSGDELILNVQ